MSQTIDHQCCHSCHSPASTRGLPSGAEQITGVGDCQAQAREKMRGDITEMKKLDAVLTEAEAALNQLIDQLPQAEASEYRASYEARKALCEENPWALYPT